MADHTTADKSKRNRNGQQTKVAPASEPGKSRKPVPPDAEARPVETPPNAPERQIVEVELADGSKDAPAVVPPPGRNRAWISAIVAVVVIGLIAVFALLG